MVFPDRSRGILPMPDKEAIAECIPIRKLILVLLTGRYPNDRTTYCPDLGILAIRNRDPTFHGSRG